MAQSVRHLTLDFGSGHDVMVHGFEPCIGLGILSLPVCPSPTHSFSLSLSRNKLKKIYKKKILRKTHLEYYIIFIEIKPIFLKNVFNIFINF